MNARGGPQPPGPERIREAPGPGHHAAREARDGIEEVLFAIPAIPLDFDRPGLRDRLLRAIQCVYLVLDGEVIASAHLDGLTEAAAMMGEARELLARAGDDAALAPLASALASLASVEATLRTGAQAVAEIQLARRSELNAGAAVSGPPPARRFRASVGLPELHAIVRLPLLPHVLIEPAAPLPEAAAPAVVLPAPRNLDELKALAAAVASGDLQRRLLEEPAAAAPILDAATTPPFAYTPAIEEVELLRRLARDCLEDIANHRCLRKPNAVESWLDQEPFEQRILDNLDAFAAIGGAALPIVSLYNAEAKAPDPERAFAVALTLGCIDGSDTVAAAVMTLKQSDPETFPGWIEGFWLAPNPAIDAAMVDLCGSRREALAALALDVLHARGSTPDAVIESLIERAEPRLAWRIARALATALPRSQAIDEIERLTESPDDAVFVAAVQSLFRRSPDRALDRLRRTVEQPSSAARLDAALVLLCFAGHPADLYRILPALARTPSVRLLLAVGRFGHSGILDALVGCLHDASKETVAAAAESLDRITGAGLRMMVEELWEIELPPEADDAGGLPIPTRTVEKVGADPAIWTEWLDAHARDFDPQMKLRGGVPFTPLHIVDELDSKVTPPDRRAEAALEITLLSGIASPFFPDDWVARQRTHLAALRSEIASLAYRPGAWAAANRGVVAVERRDAQAPAPQPGPRIDLSKRVRDPKSSALPRVDSVVPIASDPLLPPPSSSATMGSFLAPRTQDAAPASARSVATPRASLGETLPPSTAPISPFAPLKPALPFRATPSAGSAVGLPNDATSRSPLLVASSLNATVVHDATVPLSTTLPFSVTRSPFQQDLGSTVDARAVAAGARALPFVETSSPAPPLDHSGDASRDSAETSGSSPPAPPRNVSAPSAPAPGIAAVPLAASSLDQYAYLCAELAVFPQHTEAIFDRHGFTDPQQRLIADRYWKELLHRDPGAQQQWRIAYAHYHARLIAEAKPRGPR